MARIPVPHLFLALLVVAIWGTNFVVIHLALEQFRPLMVATLRFTFAALPLVFFIRRPRAPWRNLAAYGVLIGVGQFGLLYIAMQHDISPGLASLVVQMQVFFTVGLAAWLAREPISPVQVAALGLAGAGLAVVAFYGHGAATPLGLSLTVMAALSWACGNLVGKRAGPVDVVGYMVWSSLFAVPPLLVLSLLVDGWPSMVWSVRHADAGGWAAILWQSLANTLLGYGVWSWLLARHPAAAITPTALMVPLFGLGASAVVLGEPLQPWKIGAAVLVLAGLGLNLLWAGLRRAHRA